MDTKQILRYLYSLENSRIKLGLKNIKTLLKKINNPEKELKIIHVAGTNGKGSVCAMLSSILQEAGYKVGMYTSPHLKRFNERVRINNTLITDKEIVEYFLKIKPEITNQSFFEITTALALLYFSEKKVDFAVLEVGLGGRLDATNVSKPLVSVITNVGLEHTDILGQKIEKIAKEKAGIVKKNVPVVTGAKGRALETIKKITLNKKTILIKNKKYEKNENNTFDINSYKNLKFDFLKGNFQIENASIEITTIETLNKYYKLKINKNQIKKGLEKAKWPARMQFVSKNVLVDCAHNLSGFQSLKKELLLIKKQRNIENFVFVVAILNDKDIEAMLKTISPLVSTIIFTKPDNKRASSINELASIFKKNKKKN